MFRIALVFWLLLCSPVFSQIKLSEQKTQSWVGFDNPSVSNGIVYSGPRSKPTLASTQSLIVVDYTGYEFLTTWASRVNTGERVALEQVSGGYWFPSTASPGKYQVLAIATAANKAPAIESIVVDVGGVQPQPDPTPQPPVPPTPSDVVPIPGDGLRVLIIYEQDDQAKYNASQLKQLYSLTFRQYLNSVCVKNTSGMPEYRVLDEEVEGEQSIWLEAIKRKRDTLPWLIISNGKTGFEGPLPANEAETKALIERFKL